MFETGAPGAALHAWYVRADLSDERLVFDATRVFNQTLTVAEHAARTGASVAVNGGFFSGTQPLSLVASRGYTYGSNVREVGRAGFLYYPTRGAIGRQSNGRLDVAWIYDVAGNGVQKAYPAPSPNAPDAPQPRPTATFPAGGTPWDLEAGVGGGPVLVQNGRRRITWAEEVLFGSAIDTTTASARTVAGRTADGHLLLLVAAAPGLTLPEAANLMVSLGAVEALNLDGGPSAALWADGAALLPGGQPVVSALVLRPYQFHVDPLVIDTGSACCYRETGTWAEAADSLFYGPTRSRLNETGPGLDRAIFTIPQTSGFSFCGRVEAWWSPGPDRATNTTFSYSRSSGSTFTLATVNQSAPATAGRWNPVGYVYDGSPGDAVVVTDGAAGSATPAYVSVDAVRILPSACPATESGPGAVLDLSVAPNPASGAATATATFSLPSTGDVRITVLDLLGRAVRDERVRLASGLQRVPVETAGLPAGLYVVRIEAGTAVGTARLAVVR